MIGELFATLPPTVQLLAALGAFAAGVFVLYELGVVAVAAGVVAFGFAYGRDWGTPLAVGAGVAVALLVYVGHCLLYPRTGCLRCSGAKKDTDGDGNFRNCWLCGGSGQRKRLGAKILSRHRTHSGD